MFHCGFRRFAQHSAKRASSSSSSSGSSRHNGRGFHRGTTKPSSCSGSGSGSGTASASASSSSSSSSSSNPFSSYSSSSSSYSYSSSHYTPRGSLFMHSASCVHATNMLATMPSLSLVSTVRLSSSAAPGGAGIGVSLGSSIDAGDADIERILCGSPDTTIFVDFYADWCAPCRMLAPVLKKVVAEDAKSILVKVDVDSSVETAGKYQIASLPTVVAFRNGKVIDKFIGFRDEATVRKFITENSEE